MMTDDFPFVYYTQFFLRKFLSFVQLHSRTSARYTGAIAEMESEGAHMEMDSPTDADDDTTKGRLASQVHSTNLIDLFTFPSILPMLCDRNGLTFSNVRMPLIVSQNSGRVFFTLRMP